MMAKNPDVMQLEGGSGPTTLQKIQAQLTDLKAQLAALEPPQTLPSVFGISDSQNAARLAAAAKAAADAKAGNPPTVATPEASTDTYYTKIVADGLTQAQLDAQANAIETARLIGGTTVPNPAGGVTVVAPKVTPPGGNTAADKAAADKAAAAAKAAAAQAEKERIAAEAAITAARTAKELEDAKAALAAALKAKADAAEASAAALAKANAELKAKLEADLKAAESALKAAQEKAAADLKAALESKDAKVIADAKAAKEAADKALADARAAAAAELKAAQDAAAVAAAQATADKANTNINVTGNTVIPFAGKTAADIAAQLAADKALEQKTADRIATSQMLSDRFKKYNLSSLAPKIKELAINGANEATIMLELQETEEYKQRFKANQKRIEKNLAVLDPGTYLRVEDGYRQVLREYGLKEFDTDDYVSKFIENDMSATELSNRVVTAVQRVQNADPALIKQLKDFYGIRSEGLLAYVLDPEQQFKKIERQIAAGEIGVAAGRQGLQVGSIVAEQLAAQGISEAEARRGYATIADILPTAEKLSDIYGTTLDSYGQSEGEQEVFNQLASAQRKRQRLTAREVAAFSGAAGVNKTSLTTPTVGQY